MPQDDPKELEAALTQLLEERDRRSKVRIESGEAVRAPLLVVSDTGQIDAARESAIAKLRAAGEKREVICGDQIEAIVTGVPRHQPDGLYHSGSKEAGSGIETIRQQLLPESPDVSPVSEAAPQPQRPPQPRRIITQVRDCKDGNDPGHVVEGYYDLKDGLVYVWDASDRSPIGSAPYKPGDSVEVIAKRVLREKAGKHGSFSSPILYPNKIFY